MNLKLGACLLVFAAFGWCQGDPNPYAAKDDGKIVKGHLVGRGWLAYSDAEKIAFLRAYQEGTAFAVFNAAANKDTNAFARVINGYWPYGLNVDKVKAEVDQFFDVKENGSISVVSAIGLIAFRRSGGSEDTIQNRILLLRKPAN